MLIDISKIIVGNRIRKDFGNLQELADDISENTLLNPPVITPNSDGTYTLIAGERRLRAMRDILGYKQITVNVVSAQDDERALLMEISENECRKEFTKTERLDYARRLARIETAKAKERQGTRTDIVENSPQSSDGGKSRDKVAQALGTSSNTLSREQFIEDHRDMVSLEDFEAWDEGRLSTNRVFQQIKAAQKQAEQERDEMQHHLDEATKEAAAHMWESEKLKKRVKELEKQEPEVIERTVEVEVVPDDYEQAKRRVQELEHLERVHSSDNQKLRNHLNETRQELNKARDILGMSERVQDIRRDVQYLITATNNYVRQYGGLTWTAQSLADVDETTREELTKAVKNLATFSSALVASLEEMNERNRIGQ